MDTPLTTAPGEALTLTSKEYLERPNGSAAVVDVNVNWHNENHPGAFSTCTEPLCYAVRRVARPTDWNGA